MDASDFIIPMFVEFYEYEIGSTEPLTVPDFKSFYSQSAQDCGFSWAYTITLDNEAITVDANLEVTEYVNLVTDDSNTMQL